jgi:two-component system KDP operon response regulator KdpE
LVIDDDPTLLRFLKEYFEREGFAVDAAPGGQPALRLFYANRPDLVIVDVMMPGMDGWEVTARVREMAETPVIMLTAKSGEADKLRLSSGVDDPSQALQPGRAGRRGGRAGAGRRRRERTDAVYRAGPLTVDMKKRGSTSTGRC